MSRRVLGIIITLAVLLGAGVSGVVLWKTNPKSDGIQTAGAISPVFPSLPTTPPTETSTATTAPTSPSTPSTTQAPVTLVPTVPGVKAQAVPERILYTIQPGDTLSGIAEKFAQRGWEQLFVSNWLASVGSGGIKDPNLIYPGRVIVITTTNGTSVMTVTDPRASAPAA